MAALTLINRALPAIKNKKYAVVVLLDFSACFDTICRDTLLTKLSLYGFDQNTIKFLNSYFSNRNQTVLYKGHASQILNQSFGVIQGSKMVPYFSIYIPTI